MTKWPPISHESVVETLEENPKLIKEWTPEARASRQWGVIGKVVAHHDSHGLSYEVMHPDGTIGHYDPSEINVLFLRVR